MKRNVLVWLFGVPAAVVFLFNVFVGDAARVLSEAPEAAVSAQRSATPSVRDQPASGGDHRKQ